MISLGSRLIACCKLAPTLARQMWRHNYVIDRNEYLIFTLSESINPWLYSLQFLFKSTNNSWRYERNVSGCFFLNTVYQNTVYINPLKTFLYQKDIPHYIWPIHHFVTFSSNRSRKQQKSKHDYTNHYTKYAIKCQYANCYFTMPNHFWQMPAVNYLAVENASWHHEAL